MPFQKDTEWDDRKTQYGIWLGIPYASRQDDEKSISDYAKKINVSRQALHEWAKDPEVQSIRQSAFKVLGANDTTKILEALTNKCLDGDPRAIALWMEWQGHIKKNDRKVAIPKKINVDYATDE